MPIGSRDGVGEHQIYLCAYVNNRDKQTIVNFLIEVTVTDLIEGLIAFFAYFAGSIAFCIIFCVVYTRSTPHREFYLIVHHHNLSASIAVGGNLVGFAIGLAGAIHNTGNAAEFIVWGFIALLTQVIAFQMARIAYRDISKAIDGNVLAAGVWSASVSVASGIICAACMSP